MKTFDNNLAVSIATEEMEKLHEELKNESKERDMTDKIKTLDKMNENLDREDMVWVMLLTTSSEELERYIPDPILRDRLGYVYVARNAEGRMILMDEFNSWGEIDTQTITKFNGFQYSIILFQENGKEVFEKGTKHFGRIAKLVAETYIEV